MNFIEQINSFQNLKNFYCFYSFLYLILLPFMRNKIIQKASDLFISLGFKSVTMDEIAGSLGISKKTIYIHFSNKTALIRETTHSIFHEITCGIDHIQSQQFNPIQELFEVKKFAMQLLKNEKSSPQYQLQKYYPEIFEELKEKQFEKMQECTLDNLQRGMSLGLYRDNLDQDFVARIYFLGISGIKNDHLFPAEKFTKTQLMDNYLEYHLRGIVTEKGLKILYKFINQTPIK